MNPKIKLFGQSFNIKAEQMGLINAVLILILIPIFEKLVYPGMEFIGFKFKPLVRMFWGMVFGIRVVLSPKVLEENCGADLFGCFNYKYFDYNRKSII
jgi:hypothetical protein